MRNLQASKLAELDIDDVAADASLSTDTIDTQGFQSAIAFFVADEVGAAPAAIRIQESDDSGMSGATDIFKFGVTADVANTVNALSAFTANEVVAVQIDLIGKKRYLKATFTAGSSGNSDFGFGMLLGDAVNESPADSAAGFGSTFLYRV